MNSYLKAIRPRALILYLYRIQSYASPFPVARIVLCVPVHIQCTHILSESYTVRFLIKVIAYEVSFNRLAYFGSKLVLTHFRCQEKEALSSLDPMIKIIPDCEVS